MDAFSQYPPFVPPDAEQSLDELLAFALDIRLIDDYHDQHGSMLLTIRGQHIRCTYPQAWHWLAGALKAYRKMTL